MAPKQKDVCLACGKALGRESCIQCTVCGLWIHHKPCSMVPDDGFKFLEEQMKNVGQAWWACRSCVAYSQGITQRMRLIEKEVSTVKAGVQENKAGVESNTRSIDELKQQMEKNKREMEEKIREAKVEMREEWKERELRRKNLVIHRVPEAAENVMVGEERRIHDLEECKKIMRAAGIEGAGEAIKACRRLGDPGGDPRPIILVMKSEEIKRQLLEMARNLRGTDYQEISIVPDLTPEQRKEEAELMEEAARRNMEELTEEDASKNLKWIVVGQRGERRLLKGRERVGQETRGRGKPRGRPRGTMRGGTRGGRPATFPNLTLPPATGSNLTLLGPSRKRPAGFTPSASARGGGRKERRLDRDHEVEVEDLEEEAMQEMGETEEEEEAL